MKKTGNAFPTFHANSPTCEGLTNWDLACLICLHATIISSPTLASEATADKAIETANMFFKRINFKEN